MFPEYPKFKILELDDQALLSKYLKDHNKEICEFSPVNLFIWKDFDKSKATLINDNLCILIDAANEPPFFLEPLGQNNLEETIKICLKHTGKISRISESFISLERCKKYHCKCLRNQFDYVYETKTMAELSGKKFDAKRNHIKKFSKRFTDYKFESLKPEKKNQALELFEEWFKIRSKSRYFNKLAYDSQKRALELSFDNFKELNLAGGVLLAENALKGFIIGSKLNQETVSVHFQYGDPHIQGVAQVLFWEAANKTFTGFKYMNLEQDLGIPGLRKAKLSYHPIRIERKYEIQTK